MLTDPGRAASPQIERCIKDMQDEYVRFQNIERRALGRTPFTRPVVVQFRGNNEVVSTVSINISLAGIGLLSQCEFMEHQTAVLKFHSLERVFHQIIAECRWCRPFGEEWFLSGWHFISVHRG